MKIKEVGCRYGIGSTVNTGNYQNIRPDGGGYVKVELDNNDEAEAAMLFVRMNARELAIKSYVQSTKDNIEVMTLVGKHGEKFPDHMVEAMAKSLVE